VPAPAKPGQLPELNNGSTSTSLQGWQAGAGLSTITACCAPSKAGSGSARTSPTPSRPSSASGAHWWA